MVFRYSLSNPCANVILLLYQNKFCVSSLTNFTVDYAREKVPCWTYFRIILVLFPYENNNQSNLYVTYKPPSNHCEVVARI